MHQYRMAAIDYANILSCNGVVILERPWLSHPIYAEVYREGRYNAYDVEAWKGVTEANAALNLIALPGDAQVWLDGYVKGCEERAELHGPNRGKMQAVYEGFRDAFSGDAGVDRQPMGRVNVYDMQQYPEPVDIDLFIMQHVIPHLTPKEA